VLDRTQRSPISRGSALTKNAMVKAVFQAFAMDGVKAAVHRDALMPSPCGHRLKTGARAWDILRELMLRGMYWTAVIAPISPRSSFDQAGGVPQEEAPQEGRRAASSDKTRRKAGD